MQYVMLFEAFVAEKRKTKNSPTWKDSDAPDANGKFKELGIGALAKWLIRTRGGNMQKITGSLNQQIVFNRISISNLTAIKLSLIMEIIVGCRECVQ